MLSLLHWTLLGLVLLLFGGHRQDPVPPTVSSTLRLVVDGISHYGERNKRKYIHCASAT